MESRNLILKPIVEKFKPKANQQFNYGLALLKSMSAFLIVIRHKFEASSTK